MSAIDDPVFACPWCKHQAWAHHSRGCRVAGCACDAKGLPDHYRTGPQTRVYIAAPLALASVAERFAAMAGNADYKIASTWHTVVAALAADGAPVADPIDDRERLAIVRLCLAEVACADELVVLAHDGAPRGTLVEIGVALALRKPVLWVQREGGARTVFDSHELVTRLVVPVGTLTGDVLESALAALVGAT